MANNDKKPVAKTITKATKERSSPARERHTTDPHDALFVTPPPRRTRTAGASSSVPTTAPHAMADDNDTDGGGSDHSRTVVPSQESTPKNDSPGLEERMQQLILSGNCSLKEELLTSVDQVITKKLGVQMEMLTGIIRSSDRKMEARAHGIELSVQEVSKDTAKLQDSQKALERQVALLTQSVDEVRRKLFLAESIVPLDRPVPNGKREYDGATDATVLMLGIKDRHKVTAKMVKDTLNPIFEEGNVANDRWVVLGDDQNMLSNRFVLQFLGDTHLAAAHANHALLSLREKHDERIWKKDLLWRSPRIP